MQLDDSTTEIWVGHPYLEVFEDSTASLTIDDVADPQSRQKFKRVRSSENPLTKNHDSNYWVRFSVKNTTNHDSRWLIEFFDLNTNYISFYENESHEWKRFTSGNFKSFDHRSLQHKNLTFIPQIRAHETHTFYFKFHSENDNMLKPVIRSYSQFINYSLTEYYFLGFFYGIMVLCVIYNFFFFLAVKTKTYLIHIIYILSITLYSLADDGIGFQYLWPQTPLFNHYAHSFSLLALQLTAIIFTISFLNVKKLSPDFYKFLLLLLGLYVLRFFVGLIIHGFPVRDQVFDITLPLVAFATGIYFYFKFNYVPARYFILAYVFLFLGFTISLFQRLDIIASSPFTFYSLNFAIVLEVVFLSFALVHKIRTTITEKELTQKQLVNELKLKEELKDRHNRELGQKVEERTKELNEQKELVELKNKNITASISYAKNIQNAILPSETDFKKEFPESFILYLPRDIVSGDFYYLAKHRQRTFLGVIDCTGHGVPGGFMSMIGYALLNQTIYTDNILRPEKILDNLHEGIVDGLKQYSESHIKDGMDLSLITINNTSNELEYAGANNPIIIVRNAEAVVLPADRQPIGDGTRKHAPFTLQTFDLMNGDMIYLFSDGYMDQFGGPEGKKFMKKRFRKFLIEIASHSVDEQLTILKSTFRTWSGSEDQVDDVTVTGIRFRC